MPLRNRKTQRGGTGTGDTRFVRSFNYRLISRYNVYSFLTAIYKITLFLVFLIVRGAIVDPLLTRFKVRETVAGVEYGTGIYQSGNSRAS